MPYLSWNSGFPVSENEKISINNRKKFSLSGKREYGRGVKVEGKGIRANINQGKGSIKHMQAFRSSGFPYSGSQAMKKFRYREIHGQIMADRTNK